MPNPILSFSKDDFNEAVKLAAWENYEADCALTDIDPEHRESWKDAEGRYLEEAASLLRETGKNWAPELPHHRYITIEN